jgi:outer membrane receptor protein involved in Fe transport
MLSSVLPSSRLGIWPLAACLQLLVLGVPVSGQVAPAPAPASPAATGAKNARDDVLTLTPFEVSTKKDLGYLSTNSSTATRIAMPVQDLPFSISILNQDFLSDLSLYDNDSAFRYMLNNDNNGSPAEREFSRQRGFQQIKGSAQRNTFRFDGIKDNFNIERIEIVRGPNSTIVGEADPGGQINSVTKKGVIGRSFGQLNVTTGSHSLFRTTLDYNLSTEMGGIPMALRVNALSHDSDGFIKFTHLKREGIALNYTAQLTPGTKLNLDTEYTNEDRVEDETLPDRFDQSAGFFGGFYSGLRDVNNVAIPNPGTVVGKTTYTTGAYVSNVYRYDEGGTLGPDNRRAHDARFINLTLDQRITENWYVQLAGALTLEKDAVVLAARGGTLYGATGWSKNSSGVYVYNPVGNRYFQDISWTRDVDQTFNKNLDARITSTYQLKLSWTEQTITAGAEEFWTTPAKYASEDLFGSDNKFLTYRVYLDDLTAQAFGVQRWLDTPGAHWQRQAIPMKTPKIGNTGYFVSAVGSYLNGKVRTLVGVRRDDTTVETYTGSFADAARTQPVFTRFEQVDSSATTPLYSISAAPFEGLMVYYSHGESYKPSSASRRTLKTPFDPVDPYGPTLPPETGVGDEFGLKFDLAQHKITGTIAYFDITKKNITRNIDQTLVKQLFNDPGEERRFPLPGVDSRSTGLEVEVVFNPTPNLSFIGGYAYLDAYNLHDPDPNLVGAHTDVTYNNAGYFLTKYTMTEGTLKGFYAGVGSVLRGKLYLQGKRPGVTDPPYVVFNPFFGYSTRVHNGNWVVGGAVHIDNVLNLEYNKNYARMGEPRQVEVSAFVKF